MTDVYVSSVDAAAGRLNVADRLSDAAAAQPATIAVACPRHDSPEYRPDRRGLSGTTYSSIPFADLDADATTIARGLVAWGVEPGRQLVLLVQPGIEFVALVFALLRAGVVLVLIDPGLGRRNLIRCLAEVEPDGFVAVPRAQAVRTLLRHKFPRAKRNVTVGRRWFWGGLTLRQLRELGQRSASVALPETRADDPAAILFTSGSTGPAKGVLYTQRMFDTQVAEIQAAYGIEPGGVDLACFPLFALFNSAMGVTTVLPDMDFSRPAAADPRRLLAAANDWQVTQAFASPAVWRKLSAHCAKTGERIESLRQIFSCGASVTADVLRATLAIAAPDAQMHTPYGATECLPVATIEAAEVVGETAARTDEGAGVCVGRKFDSVDWRVIRISDDPIATIDDAEELPTGEVGELVVRGPQASPSYVTRTECNAESKIADGENFWHRMGDVGYLDEAGRFWYCGRKSQRVETADGTLFTECVEAVFNGHPDIERSALIGMGPQGSQQPVITVQFKQNVESTRYAGRDAFPDFERLAMSIKPAPQALDWLDFVFLPVDVRHNSKIDRELLREATAMGVLGEADLFPKELVQAAKMDEKMRS